MTDFKMVAMDAVDHNECIDKLETHVAELQKRVNSGAGDDGRLGGPKPQ